MKKVLKPRPESATQFDEIWKEHNDPATREKKKILNNRKKREEDIKNDLGI
jgi:hypothetical protein